MSDSKDDFERGGLAEKLRELGLKSGGSRRPKASEPATPERVAPAQPDVTMEAAKPALSPEQLFERAVAGLGPQDMYRGKFEGRGAPNAAGADPSSSRQRASKTSPDGHAASPSVDEEAARERVSAVREKRHFEKVVGPVDARLEHSKYRTPSAQRDPEADVARRLAARGRSAFGLLTPALPTSGEGLHHVGPLGVAHRELLGRFKKRARRHEIPELNVRGDSEADALRQLELFVHQHCKQGERFCRVVHGRGLRSAGEPVLKPAVLGWLHGPGLRYVRGYAPEVNSAGDYGSLVVEFCEYDPSSEDPR